MKKIQSKLHPARVMLADSEWIRYKQVMKTHKAIYLAGLRAYEEKRKR